MYCEIMPHAKILWGYLIQIFFFGKKKLQIKKGCVWGIFFLEIIPKIIFNPKNKKLGFK